MSHSLPTRLEALHFLLLSCRCGSAVYLPSKCLARSENPDTAKIDMAGPVKLARYQPGRFERRRSSQVHRQTVRLIEYLLKVS